MEVFFVRHGQTGANKAHIHQPPETPLTELGREQARAVGARLKELHPTRIITSPLTRAHETAKIIGEELSLSVTSHQTLVELKRPNYIYGYKHFGPKSLWYMIQWFLKYDDPAWQQVESESYKMFIDRIQDAREYLENFRDDERIVVVSHSIFINFFVEHVCNERKMTVAEAFARMSKIIALDNSSVTHVEYHHSDTPDLCNWVVKQFDDDGHVVT